MRYRTRNEPTKTKNIEEVLDHLEITGRLKRPLHPSHIEERLRSYYDTLISTRDPQIKRIYTTKIINLMTPVIFAIIEQNFSSKYFIGGRVTLMDFFQEAVEAILKAIRRRNYKPDRGTKLYAFLYLVGYRGILSFINRTKLARTVLDLAEIGPQEILKELKPVGQVE